MQKAKGNNCQKIFFVVGCHGNADTEFFRLILISVFLKKIIEVKIH